MKKTFLILSLLVTWGVAGRPGFGADDGIASPDPIPEPAASAASTAALAVDDAERGALETLRELARTYGQKQRSAFMRLVSDDFNGDVSALEDALLKDFRSYHQIDLDLIPDRTVARENQAAVDFHYNLAVTDTSGLRQLYQGRSTYEFRLERGKMRLLRMTPPILFGNSLPTTENPMARPLGSSPSDVGSAPGAAGTSAVTGSGSVEKGVSGFRFATGAATAEGVSDLYMFLGAAELAINPGGGLQSLGIASLESIASVPANPTDQILNVSVGECFAVKTLSGAYAAIRVTAITASTISFTYKYQPSGSTSF